VLFQPHTMMWSCGLDEPKPWPSLSRKSMTIGNQGPGDHAEHGDAEED
jgi:hypothetical protein